MIVFSSNLNGKIMIILKAKTRLMEVRVNFLGIFGILVLGVNPNVLRMY